MGSALRGSYHLTQVSILVIMVRHFQEEGSPALPDLPKAVKVWLNNFVDSDDGENEDSVAGDIVEAGDEKWDPSIWEAGCELDGQRWAWEKVDGFIKESFVLAFGSYKPWIQMWRKHLTGMALTHW